MSGSNVTVVDRGPRRIARRVTVDAPASTVFDLIADPRRHHELDGSGTVRHTVAGPDRLDEGATFTVAMKMFGAPYRITSRVVDFDDGHVVEWKHPFGHHWRWEFDETTPGHTEVTEVFDYSMVRFPQWVEWMGFRSKDEQGITATLERLRVRYTDG
ncbi:dimethyladenosine transferase [Prescottella agglutinans]|uniref:Dimethyladenosine transferase n=1 Tax=Prescottella agglutinans TaxID=1644129 RepID=A0A3S3BDZ6_9NOCA|nr:SRPBCC family protein [Prescottella agglutinans]RVW09129.1 dimethyladenosine transferase [Prescottella agglutinans]